MREHHRAGLAQQGAPQRRDGRDQQAAVAHAEERRQGVDGRVRDELLELGVRELGGRHLLRGELRRRENVVEQVAGGWGGGGAADVAELHVGLAGVGAGEGAGGEDAVDDDGGEVGWAGGGVGEDEGGDLVDGAEAVLGEEDGGGGAEARLEGCEGGGGGGGFGGDDEVGDGGAGAALDGLDGDAVGEGGGAAVREERDGGAGLGEGVGEAGTVCEDCDGWWGREGREGVGEEFPEVA